MKLTTQEKAVHSALCQEDAEMQQGQWKMVYLDNAGINTDDPAVRGVLASLTKKGLYRVEDGYAWGWVKELFVVGEA